MFISYEVLECIDIHELYIGKRIAFISVVFFNESHYWYSLEDNNYYFEFKKQRGKSGFSKNESFFAVTLALIKRFSIKNVNVG